MKNNDGVVLFSTRRQILEAAQALDCEGDARARSAAVLLQQSGGNSMGVAACASNTAGWSRNEALKLQAFNHRGDGTVNAAQNVPAKPCYIPPDLL
jgi:hypothetical protein